MIALVAGFTALSTLRLVGGGYRTFAALTGRLPTIFIIGGIGDFIAGALAPIIAWRLLRRPNATTWLVACLWHLYSACDFVFANAAHVLASDEPFGPIRATVLSLIVALNGASIVAIWRTRVAQLR
jgi:hypothetical protein